MPVANTRRDRKALESRSLADDERITFLEARLKEAKYTAENADRNYEEVTDIQFRTPRFRYL